MRDILVRVVNESYEEELGSLRVPVRLIWGADDTETPPQVARAAGAIIEAAGGSVELTLLDGVGHMTPLEVPDALRDALIEAICR
jgi:pimeloyl-ACP methyl ester carboxylesterase